MVDHFTVVVHGITDERLVNPFGALELREHEPAEQNQANIMPVRDVAEDAADKGVHEVKQAKDHPVGEPVLVVVHIFALDRPDRVNSRVKHGKEGNEDLPALGEHQNHSTCEQDSREDESGVDLSLLRNFFDEADLIAIRVQDFSSLFQLFLDLVCHWSMKYIVILSRRITYLFCS